MERKETFQMTREEAQKIILEDLEGEILKGGGDEIWLMSPKPGKNSWTLKEVYESVKEDIPLEGSDSGTNLIDDYLKYEEWRKLKNFG